VTAYLFHLTVRPGQHQRLRELNDQYAGVMAAVGHDIAGLGGIEKYLLGDDYVERVEYDGDFAEFAKQFTAEREIRQFLRQVDDCFVESLQDMADQQMSCVQNLTS
jgi:hypothetical protein